MRSCARILGVWLAACAAARADVTVVFNELMYHPATNETSLEWLELHNQLAVGMDLSGWRLDGAVDYVFPEGTEIPGGGYIVVAVSPSALAAETGITNVVGPYSGRLGNGGDRVDLLNNNGRRMDRIEYGPKGDWPVAPDGAGPSLAKYDEDTASADAANWRASAQMGGTPGTTNFPPPSVVTFAAVSFNSRWKALTSGADPGAGWAAAGFNDGAWGTGTGLFAGGTAGWVPGEWRTIPGLYSSGIGTNDVAIEPGQPDPHYRLTVSSWTSGPPAPVAATVMQNHSAWLANDGASRWIGAITNGALNVPQGPYQFRTQFSLAGMDLTTAVVTLQFAVDNLLTNVALNGTFRGFAYSNFNAFSGDFVLSNGFAAGTNTLELYTVNSGTSANPGAFRVRASGSAVQRIPTNTALATGPTTQYFRTPFVVTGDVARAVLQLRLVADDGAVVHLNGTELLRLNLPGGTVSNSTKAVTNVPNAGVTGPFTFGPSGLVAGTNVLAVELHQAAGGTNDAMFGAELTVTVTNDLMANLPPLSFNELPCVTNQVFWIEIHNRGAQSLVLSNYVFKRFGDPDREYVIPTQTLPAGGFTLITRDDLGYGADPGDAIVLYTPGKAAVVDAVVAKRYPRARWPDGTGPWLHPSEETPGATNRVALRDDVVINEIMYHPRDPQGAATNSPEQWIELYNRGASAVDLTGWRLDVDGEMVFGFPDGRTLAAGGYLVIAKDADYLRTLYPAADILGNFTNRLSGGGEKIELFDNAGAPSDAAGNPVDVVDYRDGPPWPSFADGLGASLELRDPRADNSRPEAWAASDDRSKTGWNIYTYRGTATVETASSPTRWREFVLGLLEEGEVLLDDVSVVESPSGAGRQVLQNTSFEGGSTAWRFLGNHRLSGVIVDPDNAGNHVLRLVSDGYAEHMHNHAETTLAGGVAVTNGIEYQISFRAKWQAGCNRLNTRLYFNRLPRITEIAAPALAGTPGAQNSRYTANLGPTFAHLSHTPVVPTNGQAVSVSVEAADPAGVASATLRYSVNNGAWQSVPMADTPAGASTAFTAGIPGQASGSIVQFYVEAVDGLNATNCCPSGGADSRALIEVSDGSRALPGLRTVRVIMTPADTAFLHASTNVMSNSRMPCTIVCDERTVFYDAGAHLQGSERGRDASSRVGFTVRLPTDQPYRGVLEGFTVDRSGGYSGKGGDNDEILLKHAINKAGGLPGMYDDLCWFFAPRAQEDGSGLLILAKYNDEFLETQYKDGGDGDMFKLELIYYPLSNSVPGNVESVKLPQPDSVLGTDLKDLGTDPEAYRWIFLKENHTARNHYAPMVAMARAFSQTGTVLDAQMDPVMDVDEWMRAVAFISLIGGSDIYTYGNSHNLMIYFRPEDGRGMAFLWDLDYSFVQATNNVFPGTGSPNTTKLINRPQNLHAYYAHLYDLSLVTGNSTYLNRWANDYSRLVGQTWTGAVAWLADRASWVRSQIPLGTPFAITNNAGGNYGITNDHATISGTAPVTVKEIFVNGVSHPVTWTTATNWSVIVSLTGFANSLALTATDLHGAVVSNATDSIVVTNFGAPAPLPVVINEWMADNSGPGGYPDASDGLFQDWFELFNPNSNAVDLTGFHLTDDLAVPDLWEIPSNTTIVGRGFLLVWADENTNQNVGVDGALHTSFKLSGGGESIGLFDAGGVRQHAVTFGAQSQNVSQGLFPDGDTNTTYAMTNWTPHAENRLGPAETPDFSGVLSASEAGLDFGIQAVPGHAYIVEFSDALLPALWAPLTTNRAAGDVLPFTDPAPVATQRFYRAILIP